MNNQNHTPVPEDGKDDSDLATAITTNLNVIKGLISAGLQDVRECGKVNIEVLLMASRRYVDEALELNSCLIRRQLEALRQERGG